MYTNNDIVVRCQVHFGLLTRAKNQGSNKIITVFDMTSRAIFFQDLTTLNLASEKGPNWLYFKVV